MNHCKKCGKQIGEQYKYCSECGKEPEMMLKQRLGVIDIGEVELSQDEQKVINAINKNPILKWAVSILVTGLMIILGIYFLTELFN